MIEILMVDMHSQVSRGTGVYLIDINIINDNGCD